MGRRGVWTLWKRAKFLTPTGTRTQIVQSAAIPTELSRLLVYLSFFYLVCEAIGTAATSGLLCQPRVIVKMIVEKQTEWRLAGETEVLGENLPQRHFWPAQNPT
jgi:hypothetical protein